MKPLNLILLRLQLAYRKVAFSLCRSQLRLQTIPLRLRYLKALLKREYFSTVLLFREIQLCRIKTRLAALPPAEPLKKTAYQCERINHEDEQALVLDVIVFKGIAFPAFTPVPKSDPRASQLVRLPLEIFQQVRQIIGNSIYSYAQPHD